MTRIASPGDVMEVPGIRPGDGLEAVFRPRSVAVVGASRRPDSLGGVILANLLARGFAGPVYPVNPNASYVHSVRAWPSLEALPEAPDLAVIVLPAARVEAAVEACGRRGVKAVVVISAGFRETGAAGAERERRLVRIARDHGMRLVGPNCLGVLNRDDSVRLDATFAPAWPPAGPVAFSSQSGALGLAILEYASRIGVGISQFASVGNKADVSGNDLLEWWGRDPATQVILLYLESFGNPRRFLDVAGRVGRFKPILAVKSGRTRAGRRAAASHTGALAGADTAVDALCAQAGVVRTNTIEELFDAAMLLAHQPAPRGRRVGIVTNAGGPAIMASDACETHGLEVPALDPGTVRSLEAFLPPEASPGNPVDLIASATPEAFERAVKLVAADPNVDAVLVIFVPPVVTDADAVAAALVKATAGMATPPERKTILSCFMGARGVPDALRQASIPSFAFPESAAIALAHAARWGAWRNQAPGVPVVPRGMDLGRASRVVRHALERPRPTGSPGTCWLRPAEVDELLEAVGIESLPGALGRSAVECARIARRLGFPVALKVASDSITHKSDVGGVVLDLRNEDDVREAYARIEKRLAATGQRGEMAGALVQGMAGEGVDTLVGLTRDPSYGPLVAFGLGGTLVEVLGDVVFRLAPLSDRDAREMVGGIRGAKLLAGWRGVPPGDILALEDVLLRVSHLACAIPLIAEMDLNPLRVRAAGRGAVAIDARVAVRETPDPEIAGTPANGEGGRS
jgi:acetyl coenzyme A synthetase (ADP forming)-like protein